MGKKSRRLKPAKSQPLPYVARPFADLVNEGDWVSLREIVPAATVEVTLNDGRVITFASMLPGAVAGLVKPDGSIWVGMQVAHAFGDASRELAYVIELADETKPGDVIVMKDPPPGNRLQDIVKPTTAFDVKVHDGFEFWFDDPTVDESLLQTANASAIPTVRLTSVEAAYRADFTDRVFLRWALPIAEDDALLALARLRAVGEDSLDGDSRLIGAFRAYGILVPVWELDSAQSAAALEKLMPAFAKKLDAAVASTDEITSEVRQARSALSSRQVTLRP